MNYEIKFHVAGGIFSYIGILFENLLEWDKTGVLNETDTIYADSRNLINRTTFSQTNFNFFDLILDQNKFVTGKLVTSRIHPVYLDEFNEKKEDYKRISKKYLRLNKDVESYVNNFINNNFNGKTLGVHVRMTDMNHHHPYLGQVKNNHYLDTISRVLSTGNYDKLFLASDNYESIDLIKEEYGDIVVHNETEFRAVESNVDSFHYHKNVWLNSPKYYSDSFIDAVLLSNCDATIGRASLFNWGSQSFHWGKIKDYYHIEGEVSPIKDPNM
tara:strand:- start:59241 stop:60053 length:813 start_codon:yes stop_codon:yes gene_type:complete